MEEHVKRQIGPFDMKDMLQQHQMAGAGNGEKFADSLYQPQECRREIGHGDASGFGLEGAMRRTGYYSMSEGKFPEVIVEGGRVVRFYVFTSRSACPTTSGGSIFRCTAKDRGERRAKGIAIPLDPRGNVLGHSDVLCANLLATVRVTRLSRAWRAPHCFHALCVLRCQDSGSAYDLLRSLRGALVRRGNLL